MQILSVVIPVYRGKLTLTPLVSEILTHGSPSTTPSGVRYRVTEILLVDDGSADGSDAVIDDLGRSHRIVVPVRLSRNFGQHAATFAGISRSTGDWVLTMDEDGQHDPADIPALVDAAVGGAAQVVYGTPLNPPHHGPLRNAASRWAKWITAKVSGNRQARNFSSFRLISGSLARGVAAFARHGVYFDVALGWAAGRYATAGVTLRGEQRESGYSTRRLVGHFLRLTVSSGTRVLRLVGMLGIAFAILGLLVAAWIVVVKVFFGIDTEGWASLAVILSIGFGAVLFAIGVIAEYLGAALDVTLGRPAFLVVSDPASAPKS